MKAVASIGECMLELSGSGEEWRMGHAGDSFNTLWALRALLPAEWRTDYVSAFGDDPFSKSQLAFFAAHDIGTAASPRLEGERPGLYAITLRGAERSFTYWRNDAAARRLADDPALLAQSLAGRALVYFSGITLAILDEKPRAALIEAVAATRSAGSLVVFDPNHRPLLWRSADEAREAVRRALAVTDMALPTFSDEEALFGDATPDETVTRLHAAGVGEIVVKNGAEAALIAAGGQRLSVPAIQVKDPLDTTGAGDSFNGGYLAARLLGQEPLEAARRAHRIAANVVRVRGALAPFEELQRAFEGRSA